MSTGVYRQYPTARLPAPLVTPGQPLDSPIAIAALARPYAQSGAVVRLIPIGIAALIPAAGFIPAKAAAVIPRAVYPTQQLTPEVAQFLSPNVTDSPLANPLARADRSTYPLIQLPEVAIASLIPAAATYVAPLPAASVARVTYSAQMPAAETVAPFLSPNATDTVLAAPMAAVQRDRATQAQSQPARIAALLPIGVAYVPPMQQFAIARTMQGTPQPTKFAIQSSADYVFPSPLRQSHRSPYPVQLLRVRYTQPGIAPVIPDFIDSTRLLRVTFNGRMLAVDQFAATLEVGRPSNALQAEEIDSALSVDPQKRTVH